ncbi:MAG: sulfotransferase [Woeseiaceae bacterium]
MILTTQRTGSTFLVECLGSHPEIESAGEILIGVPEVVRGPRYRGRFQSLYKLWNIAKTGAWLPGNRMERFFTGGEAKVRVFKAMYNQLANPFALRYLRAHEEIRVIHLRRENLLKVHVSRLLMPTRRQLQATSPVEPVWIRVDPAQAIAAMRKGQKRYEYFERLFERHARLPISYEKLIDGACLQEDTARRICDFLDVAQPPMKSRLVKVNPESLRDMVTNYDEIAAAISRTEFADLLK